MKKSTLFRNWWVILIQGILMIALSIIIFNNPDTVLHAIAFWIGIVVIITGLVGAIAYFANEKEERDLLSLLGSIGIIIIGILMISKAIVTIKAITILFGLLVAIVGIVLISGSWDGRHRWTYWWVIALLGIGALFTGIKSVFDINQGAENISTLIGISVLISGIGLIFLAFLKKKIVDAINSVR